MSVFQLRRSAEAGDKGQTDHFSSSASSSSVSGHHWQHSTQGDTGKTPSKRNHGRPRVLRSQHPFPCWPCGGGHSPTVPWEPWCAGRLYQTTPPQAHCEAQPTAKPLEASPLPSVINLNLCRSSKTTNMLLSALGASLSTHWVMPN